MVSMIYVNPSPSDKIPAPSPIMIGTAWVQMIETADFVPDKPNKVAAAPKAGSSDKPVELHDAAPIGAPVMRTKITMHNGTVLWVQDTMDTIKALMS